MSLFDYQVSREIAAGGASFYGVLMAAMRMADTQNAGKLRLLFPEVWDELQVRYNAPGGMLEGDPEARTG